MVNFSEYLKEFIIQNQHSLRLTNKFFGKNSDKITKFYAWVDKNAPKSFEDYQQIWNTKISENKDKTQEVLEYKILFK